MKKLKIKFCPFCGRKRQKCEPMASFGIVNEEPIIDLWQIECKCGGQMIGKSKEQTVESWNIRTK